MIVVVIVVAPSFSPPSIQFNSYMANQHNSLTGIFNSKAPGTTSVVLSFVAKTNSLMKFFL